MASFAEPRVDAFVPAARLMAAQAGIHFEILPKNINKVVEAQIPVVGDVAANLAALVPAIKAGWGKGGSGISSSGRRSIRSRLGKASRGSRMKPLEVIGALERATRERKDDVIIATGVGQHQICTAQHFRLECLVEETEHVFPIVPTSKALHEQLLHHDLRESLKKLSN
ncbi:hypothetical protein NLJ89_g8201 [Agrocybe chaxingu]|uniref:Uncharacterized protein n=1 Tax=Agrocybe chaxingu TaxID=84603 RepID=A0A9W8MR06_9AGAR|nr:hypothetical protein NLJ89_g8201 [Agrocybe chaxingu]